MTAGIKTANISELANGCDEAELRSLILDLTGEFARRFHAPKPFVAGESAVPVSGKVYGATVNVIRGRFWRARRRNPFLTAAI